MKLKDILYSVFILILLSGFVGFSFVTLEIRRQLEFRVGELENEVVEQRNDKNEVRNVWENQASQNDELIRAQDEYTRAVELYEAELSKTYRFIDGRVDILSTANPQILEARERDVQEAYQKLDDRTKQVIIDKNSGREIVDQLYIDAGEDQDNRANPRDGVRQ